MSSVGRSRSQTGLVAGNNRAGIAGHPIVWVGGRLERGGGARIAPTGNLITTNVERSKTNDIILCTHYYVCVLWLLY